MSAHLVVAVGSKSVDVIPDALLVDLNNLVYCVEWRDFV